MGIGWRRSSCSMPGLRFASLAASFFGHFLHSRLRPKIVTTAFPVIQAERSRLPRCRGDLISCSLVLMTPQPFAEFIEPAFPHMTSPRLSVSPIQYSNFPPPPTPLVWRGRLHSVLKFFFVSQATFTVDSEGNGPEMNTAVRLASVE